MDKWIAMAKRFRAMADEVAKEGREFDITGRTCECCEAFRYKNFAQKQMRDRVMGLHERMIQISDSLFEKAVDKEFTDG